METKEIIIPKWYWALSIFFLLWNLLGVSTFLQQIFISDEALNALSKAEQDLYLSYPTWTKLLFAIAVFGGLIGSIGLLMKKKWAKPAFLVSLLAIIPQMTFDLFFTNSRAVYGQGAAVMPLLIIIFGIFLVWFANEAIKKSWII